MSKWIIAVLVALLIIVGQFAWRCWQDEKLAIARAAKSESDFKQYKESNNAIKQFEINLTEIIKNGQTSTDNLRHDIDNGLIELRIKVESIERDSTSACNTANTALRLARTAQQDYYNLTNAINYNKTMIKGWQEYYCLEIAPKNNTEFICEQISKQ